MKYAQSWLTDPKAFPLSISLPLVPEELDNKLVYNYFDNLLPDNLDFRKRIAQKAGIVSVELVELLRVIGRDCVGAIQFVDEREGESFYLEKKNSKLKYIELTRKEISGILSELSSIPLGYNKEKDFRISVAGAQEKTALLRINKKWYLPIQATPTTHILKPPIGFFSNGIDFSESVDNEWICMNICKKLGLEVAYVEIENFGKKKCLVVERFDRFWSKKDKYIDRVPTEDFCQVLGIAGDKKYENEGGPSIKDVMQILDSSNNREKDRKNFMKSQIVFQLLAAIDGHAKNFSILYNHTGFKLAPLYDILSVYPALSKRRIEIKDAKLAMAVGNNKKRRIKDIQIRHWYETAESCHFRKERMDEIFDELKVELKKLNFDKKSLPKDLSKEVLDKILEGVKKTGKTLGLS